MDLFLFNLDLVCLSTCCTELVLMVSVNFQFSCVKQANQLKDTKTYSRELISGAQYRLVTNLQNSFLSGEKKSR